MEDPATTSQFLEQFTGSASANLLCVIVVMLGLGIKKACSRESRCKTHVHCCCLDVSLKDKTIRSLPQVESEEGEGESTPELGESHV